MITPYSRRTATCGTTTLCSARKDKNTQVYWFYADINSVWALFDIRQVAKRHNATYEANMTPPPGTHFETFLQAELQRAADACYQLGFPK